ncbi:hypothetical protein OG896_40245 [Streptomyces sp. NBC_00669]|uniref:hypothetical protein n=1 Tax=unclassified Streptomyces TaxID=2593676 RepID=UPI002E3410D8|nr:hypothetical protein [Streptomyces sp. NBC_00669]
MVRDDIAAFARITGAAPGTAGPALPWADTRAAYGLDLPADYRAFVDAYGPGTVGSRLTPLIPLPPCGTGTGIAALGPVLDAAAEIGALLRGLREKYPDAFPYPFHPEPGGLLAWGGGVGGEQCFWLTQPADPDTWPVVVWDKADWHRYDMGMVALLNRALSGHDAFLDELVGPRPGHPLWNPEP